MVSFKLCGFFLFLFFFPSQQDLLERRELREKKVKKVIIISILFNVCLCGNSVLQNCRYGREQTLGLREMPHFGKR